MEEENNKREREGERWDMRERERLIREREREREREGEGWNMRERLIRERGGY